MIDVNALKTAQTANKNALDALLTYANDATSAGDTDIGEAIRTLVDGYGKGGDSPVPTIDGHKVYFGEITPTEVGGFTLEIPFKTTKIYFGCIWLSDYDLALNHSTENIMLASTWRNYTEAYASIYYMNSGTRQATYKSGYGFRCNSINPNTVRVGYTSYPNWPMQTEKYYYMFVFDGEGDGKTPVGLVESFDIEIPTQVTEYDIYLSKPCDMVSVALKGTPSAQSTTAWMMAYDSTIDDCGIYGIPTPTASYRFINNTSWQCRWSGTSHVPQVQTITQSSLRQELLGDKRYYAHLYRNAASYPILAGTYEVKTYKRYAD